MSRSARENYEVLRDGVEANGKIKAGLHPRPRFRIGGDSASRNDHSVIVAFLSVFDRDIR